uniref:endoglucanase 13 n=1 Tax=Ciona intestinalis TaxID=7719 RepID=UPI0005219D11|nr:endoglucanase 13 [Ciona intestinalis]|eukprot:XP_002122707.2 endoglucanase 13 [Ciona intestinalis]
MILSLSIFAVIISCSYGQNTNTSTIYTPTAWGDAFKGDIKIPINQQTSNGWRIRLLFYSPIPRIECWTGIVEEAEIGETTSEFTIVNEPYNKVLQVGTILLVNFIANFPTGVYSLISPPIVIRFQGNIIFRSSGASPTARTPEAISTTDLLSFLNSLEAEINSNSTNNGNTTNTGNTEYNGSGQNADNIQPSATTTESQNNSATTNISTTTTTRPTIITQRPRNPVPIPAVTKYNYTEILHKSLLFYEAQRSGRLPPGNRIPWRGNSAMNDRGNNGEDLTGGYYDAGDHVKFGFPMAFSITLLAWGVVEYWDVYRTTGELDNAIDALKWGTDYLLKAHVAPNVLYGQVGDGVADHRYWGRPEDMPSGNRPAFKVDRRKPGTDLAAETAAAMAATSLAIRRKANGSETPYVRNLITHAKQLFNFATTYRKLYHVSIPGAKKFYKSTSFKDELIWAALWIYRATGEDKYIRDAEGKYMNWGLFQLPHKLRFSWDDKKAGLQMLMVQVSRNLGYGAKRTVKNYCSAVRSRNTNYTEGGLLYLHEWSPLRYAANTAFICLMASNAGIDSEVNAAWARRQIHYMLGDSGRSYVVGFGTRSPQRPHHRSSSCPPRPQQCNWASEESPQPNHFVLNGALVGGPDYNDNFQDRRNNFKQSEVALDYNAGFQGAVAALQYQAVFPNLEILRNHEPWFSPHSTVGTSTTVRPRGSATAVSPQILVFILSVFASLFLIYS